MAIPSRVLEVEGLSATVECYGLKRKASLVLITEDVSAGDYLLLQAGGLAREKVDAQRAEEMLALLDQVLEERGRPSDESGA